MLRRTSHPTSANSSRRMGLERLETRRVLDCHGFDTFGLCVPGDSDENGEFDQNDLVRVLQAGQYLTGKTADWGAGDWNGDGLFDQLDVSTALRAGTYLQGVIVDDLSALVAKVPAHSLGFGPPVVITSQDQLYGAVADQAAREAIADATDFAHQKLLMFSWSGSGGDRLVAAPSVIAGQSQIELRFRFGLTNDYRPHQVLLAVSKDADWHIDVEGSVIQNDATDYRFVADASRLQVSGGLAGVSDQYRIEGSLELTRNEDGTAFFTQVDATLKGDGLSSLDGQPLDSVLNLSGLSGLQTGSSTVAFSGWDDSANAIIKIHLFTRGPALTVSGSNIPPCCDFFVYEIDAMATSGAE